MAQVAYLIAAHRDPAQLDRLLPSVWSPENLYAVHVDARSADGTFEAAARFADEHPNVHLLPRIAVLWAGYAFVELQLLSMEWLLARDPSWHHFVLLSGSCLPLRSQEYINGFLGQHLETNFALVSPQSFAVEPFLRDRIDQLFIDDYSAGRPLPASPSVRRQPPAGVELRYGSAYGLLSRTLCEHMCHAAELAELKLFLRHTFAADETFLATTLMGCPLRDTWVPDYKRELYFPPGASSPAVLTMADWPRLRDSQALFARKFDLAVDSAVMDAVLERARS